jgi:rSAM/selenodomain-associated transferase 2
VAAHLPVPVTSALDLSVVIPALNERDAIARALGCTRAAGVERIVVDGGSTDGTLEAARALGAERTLASAPGRAKQLAAGARLARGQVLLFLHADTRLDPGWPEAVRAALADPRVAGGAFALRFDSTRPSFRWIERGVRLRSRWAGLPYGDQALFVRRSVLEAEGGLRDVPIFEDLDLVRAIRRRGRLALLDESAWTSPRRYEKNGIARTLVRNNLALLAWLCGLPRASVARWYRGAPSR